MAIPVAVFNANQFALSVGVNRGTAFAVAAVNASTWFPGTPAAGSGPNWDNGGASPGNLGPGENLMQVQMGTGPITTIKGVTLPNTNPGSVQVYFFFGQTGVGTVAWYVLYSGSVVASGTSSLGA